MYEYTRQNLLKNPIKYQFSDVSKENFLTNYIIQRETFLSKISISVDKHYSVFINTLTPIEYKHILKLQRTFEVKKSFFISNEEKNISFITLFSYHLSAYLNNTFCLSLFNTLIKTNDTLSSLNIESFSSFEINLLDVSIKKELEFFKRLHNE